MKKLSLFALTNLVLVMFPAFLLANEVSYEIVGYGSRHAVVILRGVSPGTVSTSVSADKRTVRVSGIGLRFKQKNSSLLPSLFSSVKQVRRDPHTDLLMNLATEIELKPSSSANELRLILRSKSKAPVPKKQIDPKKKKKEKVVKEKRKIPIRLSYHQEKKKNAKPEPGMAIVLPDVKGLQSSNEFSAELRKVAYFFDLLWAWMTNSELSFIEAETGIATTPSEKNQVEELSRLVHELTRELVEVRKELETKSEQLEKLSNISDRTP